MIKKMEVDAPSDMFSYWPGYTGAFTRRRADGALPNGTRVKKIKVEEGDTHPVGALATVLGSIRDPDGERRIMYFIEWDAMPKTAVACIAWKLEKA